MAYREDVLEDKAATELQKLGFLVERDVRILVGGVRGRTARADLIAWAADDSGELIRDVVVEIRRPSRKDVLPQLSQVATLAGARRAFVFDGEWFAVNSAFSELRASEAPRPQHRFDRVSVPDQVLEEVLRSLVWSEAERQRSRAVSKDMSLALEAVLTLLQQEPEQTDRASLARAPGAELAVARIMSTFLPEWGVPHSLVAGMARLLSPCGPMSVLDPVCGLGSCLWAAAEVARRVQSEIVLTGWDVNPRSLEVARQLAKFARVGAQLELTPRSPHSHSSRTPERANSVLSDRIPALALPRGAFDAIISIFPFNAKSTEPFALKNGRTTHSTDLALLDSVPDLLRDGGRAVLVVPPRLLFEEGVAHSVRERLAATVRLVAIVQLPAGLFLNSMVQCGLIVLERAAQSETLVAQLTDDWQEQLTSEGAFMRAFRSHAGW